MRPIKIEKQKIWFGFVTILLIAIVLISGCTSDTEYAQPSKAESESPKTQIFSVGDTATDNELKITVNKVKFVSKIYEKDNEFLIVEAPSEKQYVIIDITVENVLAKTQIVEVFEHMTLFDQNGYKYIVDFEGSAALDNSFKEGGILPGMKKIGGIAYIVPKEATDLKLLYSFDSFVGTTVIFDIK